MSASEDFGQRESGRVGIHRLSVSFEPREAWADADPATLGERRRFNVYGDGLTDDEAAATDEEARVSVVLLLTRAQAERVATDLLRELAEPERVNA